MAVVESKTLPTVTPPWLQQAQQAPKQQAPQQNTQQQPQFQQPKPNYTGIAGKLFAKPIGNAIAPYFGAGGGATGIGSAVSAGGGTFATGSGLAGTASPINTTVGAAGKGATSSFAGGLKGGIANAGIGFAAGFLGDKIFGGQGGTGASIGATIGNIAFPGVGAVVGGLIGGFAGGLFGGDEKRTYFGIAQNGDPKSDRYYKKVETPLGYVGVYGTKGARKARDPVQQAFVKSDTEVSKLLDEDQLARAKQKLASTSDRQLTRWSQNPQRAETIVKRAIKWRYEKVSEAIDPAFGGTFNRVADDKNMGGLISTLATIDRDRRNGQNIFAGKDVKNGQQAIDVIAKTYGLADKKPQLKSIQTQRPTELAKPTGGQPLAGGMYAGMWGSQPKQDTSGWEYRGGGMGIKGGWVKAQPQFGTVGGYENALKAKQQQWDREKQKVDAANAKALGAWEKQVLDAYADNYGQGQVQGSASNVANVGIARSNQVQSTNAQGKASSKRNRLFGNVKQQSVKLNRATQNSDASTNAGGLLQQSEVA